MNKRIIKIIFFISTCFSACKANAQTALDYYVLPMNTMVSIGEKMVLKLQYHDQNFDARNGTAALLTGALPQWTIISASNNDVGSIHQEPTGLSAVYTAPEKVPKTNPVIVTVKFKANDTSKQVVTVLCHLHIVDPGQNWFFAYTYSQSESDVTKSQNEEHSKQVNANANSSMIIAAAPPDKGYVLINTGEGDSILDYASGGSYSEDVKDVSYEVNRTVAEKTIRHYTGHPSARKSGVEFSYNPSDGGGIQAAGLTFDITGTDKFWVPGDTPGQLKESTESIDDKNARSILLGHSEDAVKKIKNGFTIDYRQSKDTTYTDFKGMHTIKIMEQYHAQLTRVNKKMK